MPHDSDRGINPYATSVSVPTKDRRAKHVRDDSITCAIVVLLVCIALAPVFVVAGYALAGLFGIGDFFGDDF